MVRMENITNRELLTAYIRMRYPKQDNSQAVCVIMLDEVECEDKMNMLKDAMEESRVLPQGYFMLPGNLIIEMPAGLAISLCNKFKKAGFTILVYRDGNIIHENK